MSAGHRHADGDIDVRGLSTVTINRLIQNAEVRLRLYAPHTLNQECDLPYLAGYSEDGKTIYIDRHLPDTLTCEIDGHKHVFDPRPHLVDHEKFEKSVMDGLGWHYKHAHEAANGYERRGVLKAGLFWGPYNKVYTPYIKADEHEKLKKLPKDLDMRPYTQPPVDKKLVARMYQAMGVSEGKKSKSEVDYGPGMKSAHCGICEYFEMDHKNGCHLVSGHIEASKWCNLFSERK